MGYRDLLVYLDDTAGNEARLELACGLAQRHSAHLVALAVAELVAVPELAPTQAIEEQEQRARERNDRLHEVFERVTRPHDISAEWRAAESLSIAGGVLETLGLHARYADLVVVGQSDPSDQRGLLPRDMPGQLAVVSGTPVLALPYAWHPHDVGKRVLIAWDAGREAARAVRDALPLLAGAEAVRVSAYTKRGGLHGHGDLPAADIATHLARHGLKVEAQHNVVPDIDVADAMLSEASDFGADMIVMGAYGKARLRELVLGGTTRQILKEMTVPVLMSH